MTILSKAKMEIIEILLSRSFASL